MKVLMSGSTGFIGSALVRALEADGHKVGRLVRPGGPSDTNTVLWDIKGKTIEAEALAAYDAVVHLAGESLVGRWNDDKKNAILRSRVDGTSLLANAIRALDTPPKIFVQASAIGYYGNRGDEELTEASPRGTGFLADVVEQWESASRVLDDTEVRVVRLRFSVVLDPDGGAMAKMLTPFKAGVGGKLATGKQYMSWVTRDDVVGIARFALTNESLSGAVNATAPNPVTNAEFTDALGDALNRPTVATVPAFALKAMLGTEAAQEMLLASTRVIPKKLLDAGYEFKHAEIHSALKDLVG